ncbi:hypothetical protein PE067_00735 [Paracoccus sp. DMF-8]|uniref:hypothetical protein n=1 Tax=Paracoccus sp. DMF-8 TaxID=3019445 RepID=UPI0023E8AF71|nr:hypothetical protein [Paracoccus sp. DMF-8]MDF3604812.1 hypothetical protein [Paracoccus sp. DMF-8]
MIVQETCDLCGGYGTDSKRRECLKCYGLGKVERRVPDPPRPKKRRASVQPGPSDLVRLIQMALFGAVAYYCHARWGNPQAQEPWTQWILPVAAGLVAAALWQIIATLAAITLGYVLFVAD